MMLSKAEASKKNGSSNLKKLLKDGETVNKDMFLDRSSSKNPTSSAISRSKSTRKPQLPDPKPRSKGGGGGSSSSSSSSRNVDHNSQSDKKSIWNWRPLKALSHIRHKRFNCCFYLEVHLIEGLPSSFDDASLSVSWKRRDSVLMTRPSKVVQGVAEFEDKLTYTCSVYGSRGGPHHSAKYEAKHFLLYASLLSAPELDLGKHRVDLTRLLPLTLEDLEVGKISGKWTTSFRLSGIAKGGVLNVSFGYMVVGDNTNATRDSLNSPNALSLRQNSMPLMRPDVKPRQLDGSSKLKSIRSWSTSQFDDVKDLREVSPVSKSALNSLIDVLYKKIDEEKAWSPSNSEPEFDVFTENLDPTKPDDVSPSDSWKENPEEHACDYGNTCPVHNKHELDLFKEKLEMVKPDEYPLPHSGKENRDGCQGNEFFVVDKSIESSLDDEPVKLEESIIKAPEDTATINSTYARDTAGIQGSSEDSVKHDSLDEVNGSSSRDQAVLNEFSCKEGDLYMEELLLQEFESAINNFSDLTTVAQESPKIMDAKSKYETRKSHSFDDVTESVTSEFLSMLDVDHSPTGLSSENEPESPRELLLRQFEKEAEDGRFSLFNFDVDYDNEADDGDEASIGSEQWKFSEGIKSSSLLQAMQEEHPVESHDVKSKQTAQMLEDLETEALMREWGLNEKPFHHSPPKGYGGFGSPIQLPPEETPTLPPLADGMGPFLQTKDGGFLRSMDPSIFSNSKNGGSLIMQVSSPVVVPAEMGSGIMDVLQCLASVGIEKLSTQAKELMPLEDITGKTMQQIAWEAMPALEGGTERQCRLQHDSITGLNTTFVQSELKGTRSGLKLDKISSSSVRNPTGSDSEFVSLEDLAPLAMNKIEALSMEGLRIQSGMSEEDAPSNIVAQSIDISGSLGLEGAGGLQLLDVKDGSSNGVDGIMGLSLTLDEWMRLDSGEIDDMDNISEHTSKLLAAHHANSFDFIRGSSRGERKRGKGRKCGLLGNNFIVALMVQLRDPLRNYESVGTPMLALIQVERVFVPPKPKIYFNVTELRNKKYEEDESEIVAKVEMKENTEEDKSSEEEEIPQFKITEVHVAGLKTEPQKKFWGSSSQQKSGFRWLLGNGMGKNNKQPVMKPKTAAKSSAPDTKKVQPGDTLWSISSRIFGTGAKWKRLAALNPHKRNPNVIIPNETVRLH
ncbi:PREDICTED: protein PLASTID MOVEMENT IMPAIRED 1-RELATED 1-like isoform X2 [Lupinus angustifolius]|uniref:protein PLASTID MOVEMENT IMPAIRED 1-RELATED 1-like isoform X2 n=1 Tax=Lupinus angustifolius TaxID=3871 RepID=UPI00092E8B13|nr:PREDICTED: protein PLASTID MOVEMENT IMPAIRED 1-RELATED 1-like isoform X2 [Lupinus angustifolius]